MEAGYLLQKIDDKSEIQKMNCKRRRKKKKIKKLFSQKKEQVIKILFKFLMKYKKDVCACIAY